MTGAQGHWMAPPPAEAREPKLPIVTAAFWIIQILATAAGETLNDSIIRNLAVEWPRAALFTGGALAVVLAVQLRLARHVPGLYWLAVMLSAVLGTLAADTLPANFGFSQARTVVVGFGGLLLVLSTWYVSERTVAVRAVTTVRREVFYWLALLTIFFLGAALSDLVAQQLSVGYGLSALVFAALILAVAVARWQVPLNGVTAFWIGCALTGPLGVAIGDRLAQPVTATGLGLGTAQTCALAIAALLAVMTVPVDPQESDDGRPA